MRLLLVSKSKRISFPSGLSNHLLSPIRLHFVVITKYVFEVVELSCTPHQIKKQPVGEFRFAVNVKHSPFLLIFSPQHLSMTVLHHRYHHVHIDQAQVFSSNHFTNCLLSLRLLIPQNQTLILLHHLHLRVLHQLPSDQRIIKFFQKFYQRVLLSLFNVQSYVLQKIFSCCYHSSLFFLHVYYSFVEFNLKNL